MAEAADVVRRPVWEGMQLVAGLWFTHAWPDESTRIAHLVAAWSPGARALRFTEGDMLHFAAPQWRRCDTGAGLALCHVGNRTVASAPLAPEERRRVEGADIGIVEGARLTPLWIVNADVLDLSAYIDIGDYALHDTYDCHEALPPPAHEPLKGKTVRDMVGNKVAPPSDETERLVRALTEQRDGKPNSAGTPQSVPRKRAWREVVRDWFHAVAPAVAALVPARKKAASPQRWRDVLGHIAMFTRLSRLIGRQHAAHLARLLRLFDDGNIDEALRHAIPLGDEKTGSLGEAFGGLMRRTDLKLSTQRSAGTSIGLGDALMDHLRERYRRTFEKLDRAGRVDEAVFVLAELLNARQEALDYLIKHDRVAQAAELALGWDMPPAAIIRLLMLAGDTKRAVLVARRDNAFANAVAELEPKHAELAAVLRREWGIALASRGEWLLAFDAVWPVPDARALSIEWLTAAEAAGRVLSARALVRRAQLLPDTLAAYGERIRGMLEPEAPATAREAMAQALTDDKPVNAAVRTLARAVLPMAAADRAAGANSLSKAQLEQLVRIANDAALKADLPPWRSSVAATGHNVYARAQPEPLALPVPPAGLHAISDAVALADDRWLVALGETGAAVVDASGRITQRYAVPADLLVIAQNRLVALAVAGRGEMRQITRLDLVKRTAVDLGVMPQRDHAPTFDGLAWTVVGKGRIQVLDTTSPARDVLWQVGDLPGEVIATAFDERREAFLLRQGGLPDGRQETWRLQESDPFEIWRYEWPGRRLASRSGGVTPKTVDDRDCWQLHPSGVLFRARVEIDLAGVATLVYDWQGGRRTPLGAMSPDEPFFATFDCFDAALLVGVHTERENRYTLVRLSDGVRLAAVVWPGPSAARVREQGAHLLWFDDNGRLLDLDTGTARSRAITVG